MIEKKEVTVVKTGDIIKGDGIEYEVHDACSVDDGRWVCLTHGEVFINNLQLWNHTHSGEHKLVWFCYHHYRYESEAK